MTDFNKLYPHYDGTPRTDENEESWLTFESEGFGGSGFVNIEFCRFLERSLRANIKARWEIRRWMMNTLMFYTEGRDQIDQNGKAYTSHTQTAYWIYLQGLKK